MVLDTPVTKQACAILWTTKEHERMILDWGHRGTRSQPFLRELACVGWPVEWRWSWALTVLRASCAACLQRRTHCGQALHSHPAKTAGPNRYP